MKTPFAQLLVPFLNSLTLKAPCTDSLPIAVLTPTVFSEDGCRRIVTSQHAIYKRHDSEMTLNGFRKRLLELLRAADHTATDPIADAILGCAVGAADTGEDRAKFLTDLLTRFGNAEVSHFFVLQHEALAGTVHFEGYRLGKIDLAILGSRCRRAQSDYAAKYGDQLENRVCLQSPEFRHIVIDFLRPMRDLRLVDNKRFCDLLLNYFTQLSRRHFEHMWAHLNQSQLLLSAFDAELFDPHYLKTELGRFADKVTIYLGFSKVDAGYVLPEAQRSVYLQSGPESSRFSRYKQHRDKYHLTEVGDSELGRTLFDMASFHQQAVRFLDADRFDDAALYAMICLEQVFSEKKAAVDATCSRTAVVVHLRLGKSFVDSERELRTLYEARSQFVHAGKNVKAADAERLIAYSGATLRAMVQLHCDATTRLTGFLDRWRKELDFIVAGLNAGRSFDPEFLAERGIFQHVPEGDVEPS